MRETIGELLDQVIAHIDSLVASEPGWAQGVIRWEISPLYDQINFFRTLVNSGGYPENLGRASDAFRTLAQALTALGESMGEKSALLALNDAEVWLDPTASETYNTEFDNVKGHLQPAVTCATLLGEKLADETAVSVKYYKDLYNAVINFAWAVGSMAVGAATFVTEIGAILGALATAVSGIIGTVDLAMVLYVKSATIEDKCDRTWPQPSFATR